jgi:hypothetical protein
MLKTGKQKQTSTSNSAMMVETLEGRDLFSFSWGVAQPTEGILIGLRQPAVQMAPTAFTVPTDSFKAAPPASP